MELIQLEIFVSLAKNLSFSKTAKELYISQPTISTRISSLEKYLGVQLLVRNTKEVALTKSGADFLPHAQKILSLRDQAKRSVSGDDRQLQCTIDMISSTIPAQHLLPEIIASFKEQWPNVLFRVSQADSRQVEQELRGFRYDFGMAGTAPCGNFLVHYPVYDDELVLVVPNDAPEDPEEITWDNLAQYITRMPFVMREHGSGTRAEIEAMLSKIGVDWQALNISAYFSDTHSILSAVSQGMGISMVSKVAAAMYAGAGVLRMVEPGNRLFLRQIHLLYNKKLWLSPIQNAFADHARQFYSKQTASDS